MGLLCLPVATKCVDFNQKTGIPQGHLLAEALTTRGGWVLYDCIYLYEFKQLISYLNMTLKAYGDISPIFYLLLQKLYMHC